MKCSDEFLPQEYHALFRESSFARVLRDRLAALETDDSCPWRICFHDVTENPDVVTLVCRDENNSPVAGTPSQGEYLFSRTAHTVYDNDVTAAPVVEQLKQLEEFTVRVKKVYIESR